MKFYIATSLANAERAGTLRDLLTRAGHVCTYDWMEQGPVVSVDFQKKVDLEPAQQIEMRVRADDDVAGVLQAHFLIVIFPGGCGTHVELGLAIGAAASLQALDSALSKNQRSLDDMKQPSRTDELDSDELQELAAHKAQKAQLKALRMNLRLGHGWMPRAPKVILWAEGGLANAHVGYPCVFHHLSDLVVEEGDMASLITTLSVEDANRRNER